jgi:hypothetical protein
MWSWEEETENEEKLRMKRMHDNKRPLKVARVEI